MASEIWKDIEGYERKYQISNLGRVKSLNYNREKRHKLLKTTSDKDGYPVIGLNKNCKKKMVKIHRLIAIHFIPKIKGKI